MKTKESYPTRYNIHICGNFFQICNICNRQFCSECDATICTAYSFKNLKPCCRSAILEYCNLPQRIQIIDITDGKL